MSDHKQISKLESFIINLCSPIDWVMFDHSSFAKITREKRVLYLEYLHHKEKGFPLGERADFYIYNWPCGLLVRAAAYLHKEK